MNELTKQHKNGFSLQPANLSEAMEFAKLMADSDLVPAGYKKNPANCLIAVQMGSELGLGPMQAVQNIAVINGKPGIYGDVGKALLLREGCMIEEADIEQIRQTKIARCRVTRPDGRTAERTYSEADAKTAGLFGKQGPWTTNPYRQMAWRAFWFAARDIAADLLRGLGGREELEDFEPTEPKNVTPHALAIAPPRRLSELSPEPATEPVVRQAVSEPEPEPTEPPAPSQEFVTGSSLGNSVHVESINTKSGSKNGREWTAYFIKFSGGLEAGTFDTKLSDACRDAYEGGYPVIVTTAPNAKNPDKFNLVSVVRAEEQMTDTDIRF